MHRATGGSSSSLPAFLPWEAPDQMSLAEAFHPFFWQGSGFAGAAGLSPFISPQ